MGGRECKQPFVFWHKSENGAKPINLRDSEGCMRVLSILRRKGLGIRTTFQAENDFFVVVLNLDPVGKFVTQAEDELVVLSRRPCKLVIAVCMLVISCCRC